MHTHVLPFSEFKPLPLYNHVHVPDLGNWHIESVHPAAVVYIPKKKSAAAVGVNSSLSNQLKL